MRAPPRAWPSVLISGTCLPPGRSQHSFPPPCSGLRPPQHPRLAGPGWHHPGPARPLHTGPPPPLPTPPQGPRRKLRLRRGGPDVTQLWDEGGGRSSQCRLPSWPPDPLSPEQGRAQAGGCRPVSPRGAEGGAVWRAGPPPGAGSKPVRPPQTTISRSHFSTQPRASARLRQAGRGR